ncbi:MAG TPA: hemolysin family protein [Abditibacteriaceae bacterium]|nr:hemolysin family protein [Abditibacteriaceae bacterium]
MLYFALIVCLLMVALLSASEGVLLATNRVRLQQWLQMHAGTTAIGAGATDSDEMLGLASLPDEAQRFIATVTIAASVPFLAASSLCAHLMLRRYGATLPSFAACLGLGLAAIVLFQMVPRLLVAASSHAESSRYAWWFAPSRAMVWLLRPPVALLMMMGAMLLRPLGVLKTPVRRRETTSRSDDEEDERAEEIRDLVESAHDAGALEDGGRELLESIFTFGDTRVHEIMVPRPDIFALPLDASPNRVLDALRDSGFSRVPVYEGDVDHIVGVLHVKDILRRWALGERDFVLNDVMRPALYIPETQKIDEAMTRMQRTRTHLALVMDEFGGTAGLLTVEDILEELVGEIADEHDKREPHPLQILDEHTAIADALLHTEDLEEMWGLALPSGEFDSVGGFMIEQLGRAPLAGDRIETANATLTIQSVRGRRPHKIFIVRKQPQS